MKADKVTQFPFVTWGGMFLLLVVTVFTRFFDIANKPIHFDESINGWFVMQMKTLGYYKYDPINYHGPLYFYLLQFFEFFGGRSLQILRSLPAVFSVLSVLIFCGRILSSLVLQRWLAVFILLSPSFLFFGRSGIHEMPFVFFQIVFALGVLRWFEKEDSTALALGVIGFFGMITLKETFAITLFCWGLALLSLGPATLRDFFLSRSWRRAWTAGLSWLCAGSFLVFVALYTGLFKNWMGLVDFFRAFLPWLKTGVHGVGHDKPFFYWIEVMWQAEPLVLLGVLFAFAGLFSSDKSFRLISVFSLAQLVVYSIIPYKTVWCILSLVWGFYFVLAYTFLRLKLLSDFRRVLMLLIGVIFVGVGFQSSYRSVFRHPLDMEHPFFYVNSTVDLQTLQNLLISTAKANPKLSQEPFQIGMQEQWPWPWVLADLKSLHYDLCAKRLIENAAVYFCDVPEAPFLDARLHEPYWKIRLTLRQSREPSMVYLKKSFFPEVPFHEGVSEVGLDEEEK